jgi:integrase
MRIRLKGINSHTARLADGTFRTYWYAWKGGPRLQGEPGSPEFVASYNEAAAQKLIAPSGWLLSLLQRYQASDDFRRLAQRTQEDYAGIIRKVIEPEFSDFPLSALNDKRTRGIFMDWRDRLALKSRRQADYAWTVLALVLSWSKDRGRIDVNPCERGGRIYRGSRAEKIWTDDDEAQFLKSSPIHLRLPLLLALWTGQRQGDLLRLPWSAYDGTHIRLKQSKGGVRVIIPIGAPLKRALDGATKRSPIVMTTIDGNPWTPDGFRASWRKACKRAGIVGVTFNDLRGTAVTRLAIAGCTEPEIATITGHSLRDVRSILDAHYLHRDPALAESAIRKLERRQSLPNERPNGL